MTLSNRKLIYWTLVSHITKPIRFSCMNTLYTPWDFQSWSTGNVDRVRKHLIFSLSPICNLLYCEFILTPYFLIMGSSSKFFINRKIRFILKYKFVDFTQFTLIYNIIVWRKKFFNIYQKNTQTLLFIYVDNQFL